MNAVSRFLSLAGAAALCLLTACSTTPFIPVAVPESYSLRPEPAVNHALQFAELEKLQRATPPEYLIAPGDAFSVVVDGHPNMSRPRVIIMPDGTISIAPIGSIKLAGLTLPAAGELLKSKYRKYLRECNVVLEPLELKNYTFTIGGMVTEPGIYPFVFGSFRLTDAVAMAKGLLFTGGTAGEKLLLSDLANAYIVRNGKILPVDFVQALEKGDPLYNIPIMNGDYIYIPSLESGKVTILGEVDEPDSVPYQPNLTVLQAIGLVGGLKETNSREIKVIRGGLKSPVVYTLDIRDMQRGRTMDFALKPKDIVFVPRDGVSEWNVIIRQILPTIQLLNGLAGPFGSPSSFLYQ